jgi:adenosylhomocysteine nucleosidase
MNIAIVAAMAMEFSTFRWYMGRVSKMPLGVWHHYIWQHLGNKVILLETGMGAEKAGAALNLLLKTYPIDCIINFGSAGMISEHLQVGEIFLADQIVEGSSGITIDTNDQMNYAIGAFLNAEQKDFTTGRLLTSIEPISKRSHRQKLSKTFQVGAVDMEAYALAYTAREHNIPFTSLKMISDSASTWSRLEFWKNLPQIDRNLGKLMYGFMEYLKKAA